MFALASLLLIAITTLGGGSTAYAAQGALPGDVLYPLKIGLERAQAAATLNEEGRAQLHVRRAERRLEETARLLEQGRERDLGEALRRYGQEIEALGAALQGQPGSEPAKLHRGELAQRVAEATAKHLEVLERVEAKAPEQAQSALAHALEVSRKGHEQALSRVEEARERARERAPEERGPDRGQGQKRGQEDSQIEAATSKLEGTLVVSVAPGSGAVTATVGGVAVDLSQLGLTPAELQALNGRVVELEGISVGGSLLALELEREDRSRIERDKSASENKEEKATAKAEEEKAKAAAAAERAKAKAEEEKAKAAAAAERAKAEAEEEKAKAAAAAERAKAKAEEKKAKEGNGDKDRDNGKDDDD